MVPIFSSGYQLHFKSRANTIVHGTATAIPSEDIRFAQMGQKKVQAFCIASHVE